MSGFQVDSCSTARVTLATDEIGRTWEHFWLGDNYIFSNQIPNRQSFTTTNPGEVIYQRGLCEGMAQPSTPNSPQTANAGAAGESAVMGLIMVLAIAGAGVYAWYQKGADDGATGYHPMADVPEMPWVFWRRSATSDSRASTQQAANNEATDSPLSEDGGDSQDGAQPSDDGVIEVPWDEPSPAVNEESTPVNGDTVPADLPKTPYQLDKLKGMSMKDFKAQLAKHGITAEAGAFKSVELLQYDGGKLFVDRRMMAFWQEFGSRRIPHAVYFVFGLQDGGNRSPQFKEKYNQAREWVAQWYQENLPNE